MGGKPNVKFFTVDPYFWAMSYVGLSKGAQNDTYWPPGGVPESILRSDMLVHWVKVTWAKDGGSGTPWDPTIFFQKKYTPV